MSTTNKGHLDTARRHTLEAVKYVGALGNDSLFRAHLQAANLALSLNHSNYLDYISKNGLERKDKEWLKDINNKST